MFKYFTEANKNYNDKNYPKALELYMKSLEIKENEVDSLYNIGVCYIKLKEYELAIEYFKNAISKHPNDSRYYFNMGYAFSMLNNAQQAYIHFNIAWALDNEDVDCEKSIRLLEGRMFKN